MKKIVSYLLICLSAGLISCDDDAIYKGELYKNIIALTSSGDYNVFQEIHELTDNETVGYIAASCGGTISTNEDIIITLEENDEPLQWYNKSNFDADINRYARPLPSENYTIDNYQILIPAGERTGKMMLKVKGDGLSPDSIYFLPLKIKNVSAHEINEDKQSILYQVVIKNDYASQSTDLGQVWAGSLYSMTGLRNNTPVISSKQLQPISWNRIRLMAGTEPFQADKDIINRGSIVMEVKYDNRVKITPYDNVYVKQIEGDADFPNEYKEEFDPLTNRYFHVFKICYEYRIENGALVQMREELRMEIK